MRKILIIVLTLTLSFLLNGCGGSGDTTETANTVDLVACDSNVTNTPCETEGLPYVCLYKGDTVIKEESNTLVRILDIDHDDTKRICVIKGAAYILRGN